MLVTWPVWADLRAIAVPFWRLRPWVAAAVSMGLGMDAAIKLLIAPMVLAGFGIILSLIGIFMVR